MMFKLTIAAVIAAVASARGCPDLAQFRSEAVLTQYDKSKMYGHWYENAY